MQTTSSLLKNSTRSFSSIIALTIALTCTMFALLSVRPETTRYQYNSTGYPKQKKFDGRQLFPIPVKLYPVLPAPSQDDLKPCIE